jgi:hypothetical protein
MLPGWGRQAVLRVKPDDECHDNDESSPFAGRMLRASLDVVGDYKPSHKILNFWSWRGIKRRTRIPPPCLWFESPIGAERQLGARIANGRRPVGQRQEQM